MKKKPYLRMRIISLILAFLFSISLFSCVEEKELVGLDVPQISKITLNEAEIAVKLSLVNDVVIEQGVVLSTKPIKGLNSASSEGELLKLPGIISGDSLKVNIRELSANTQYWVCAYVVNRAGEAHSCVSSFKTKVVKDIDGNYYGSVKILNQEWLTENLKVTRLRDGTPLTKAVDLDDFWYSNNPLFAAYNQSDSLAMIFGYHYNSIAASHELIAPEGWRVPTSEDWQEFGKFAITNAGSLHILSEYFWRGLSNPANPNAQSYPRNQSGFSLLPAGIIAYDKEVNAYRCQNLFYSAVLWSSSQEGLVNVPMIFSNHYMLITNFFTNEKAGFSIRLIKE